MDLLSKITNISEQKEFDKTTNLFLYFDIDEDQTLHLDYIYEVRETVYTMPQVYMGIWNLTENQTFA